MVRVESQKWNDVGKPTSQEQNDRFVRIEEECEGFANNPSERDNKSGSQTCR